MLFSSNVFLFLFLPIVLGLYFALPVALRNLFLLAASLFFYAWGLPWLMSVMVGSIAANYCLGLWIDRVRQKPWGGWVLALTVAMNLGLLVHFKYRNFLADLLRELLAPCGIEIPKFGPVELPIGISFYTFHALSYVIDVYRGKIAVQRNPISLALYITFFPQLIAGPIVRYTDIASQIARRVVTTELFAEGIQRFAIGLAKKLLIANSVAVIADSVFGIPDSQLTGAVAWLGVLCYTLQIYFDFSGYSDMAVGLGLMFGFRFLENFNAPYVARSVTEFWRRWHISLSTWFRDYLYIPLGGNRAGTLRTYANLLIVFLLCGFWHGASWNFALWGLFHGSFLVLERWGLSALLARCWAPVAHLYTLLAVMLGWVLFRTENLTHAAVVLNAMVGGSTATGTEFPLAMYLDSGSVLAIVLGCVCSISWGTLWTAKLAEWRTALTSRPTAALWFESGLAVGRISAVTALLAAGAVMMSASTYNPFIYFRF